MSYLSLLWYFDEFAQCEGAKYFIMTELELEGPTQVQS